MARLTGTLSLVFAITVSSPVAAQTTMTDEVRGVFQDQAVQAALAWVEEQDDQTMADLVTLTEIPAPPFMEGERARAFLRMLRDLGVDTAYIDAEGNVIARRSGTSGTRVVAISAHLDTVFPEGTDTSVRIAGDTLFAPGVGDDTRGLAAVLAVLRALNGADVRTEADILFIGTVGEEGLGDLRGVKHLFREGGPQIDAFMSVDGTSDSGITHGGLGSYRYRVTFEGPGGHSWGAFGLANPAHALARAVRYFQDEADSFTRSGPRTSYNVGRMGGGTSVNSVPFEAWMEVDMRSESRSSLEAIDALFQAAMQRGLTEENELRRQGAPLTVDVRLIGDRPSGMIPEDDPFVQRAVAVTELLGRTPSLGVGSTDSNIPISLGIPSVTIGGGGRGLEAHSPQEAYVNRDGHVGVQRALLIVVAEAGLARAS
jgi:acetylornithine deacetylase/succinyl-diaminopimelate desuccinylase-like protein